jgi:predicted  nucleic acid-binding Zn-ribbon protein
MPHQCTTCGRTFPDGSKEMLSGCPDCGGNKFQFKPAGATGEDRSTSNEQSTPNGQPTSNEQSTPNGQSVADDRSASPSSDSSSAPDGADPTPPGSSDPTPAGSSDPTPTDPDPIDSDPETVEDTESTTGTDHVTDREAEDTAQASARSDVVSPDELDQASRSVDSDSGADSADSTDPEGPRPDIDELREELNEQFESIRIVSPGKYELNLMELYDRQEYIISLQEDGRYVIEMPDAWGIQDE